jgi:membrane-bound metal-dependent hydrolase YbcI (DUF457 family)
MPLPIAHGFLGATIVAALYPKLKKFYSFPIIFGGFLALVPDFDFAFDILFGADKWHRGFTHSITFALIVYLIFALICDKKHIRIVNAFGLAFLSHCILDYLTAKKGGGVELFWLFSSERFKLGWFGLSEMPTRIPAIEIFFMLLLEFIIFALPFMLVFWVRKNLSSNSSI